MKVIIARWYDSLGLDVGQEVYNENTDPEELLDFFSDCKRVFDHTTISCEGTYRVFSDGTRVELSLFEIKEFKYGKDYIGTIRERLPCF